MYITLIIELNAENDLTEIHDLCGSSMQLDMEFFYIWGVPGVVSIRTQDMAIALMLRLRFDAQVVRTEE
jgi:hypothetical protein